MRSLEQQGDSGAAYARILHAALTPEESDDQAYFVSPDEILAAWEAWDPLVARSEGTGEFAKAARHEAARLSRLGVDGQPIANQTDALTGADGQFGAGDHADAVLEQQREEAARLQEAKRIIGQLTDGQR